MGARAQHGRAGGGLRLGCVAGLFLSLGAPWHAAVVSPAQSDHLEGYQSGRMCDAKQCSLALQRREAGVPVRVILILVHHARLG